MSLVQDRAIITVPGEIGQEECRAKRLRYLETPHLYRILHEAARRWIELRAKEGQQYYDRDDIHVYGPFPSRERLEAYLTTEEMRVTSEQRSALVLEKAESPSAFSLYLLVANFMVADPETRLIFGAGAPTKGVTNGRVKVP